MATTISALETQRNHDEQRSLATQQIENTINILMEVTSEAVSEINYLRAEIVTPQNRDEYFARQRQLETDQLKEELNKTNDLLRHEKKKREMRTKAHIDSLAENAKLTMKLQSKEAEWEERFKALEETMRQKLAEKDEGWMKEVKLLKQEIRLCQESCLKKDKQRRTSEKSAEESDTTVNQEEKEDEEGEKEYENEGLLNHPADRMSCPSSSLELEQQVAEGDQKTENLKLQIQLLKRETMTRDEKKPNMENGKLTPECDVLETEKRTGVLEGTMPSGEPTTTRPSAPAVNGKMEEKRLVRKKNVLVEKEKLEDDSEKMNKREQKKEMGNGVMEVTMSSGEPITNRPSAPAVNGKTKEKTFVRKKNAMVEKEQQKNDCGKMNKREVKREKRREVMEVAMSSGEPTTAKPCNAPAAGVQSQFPKEEEQGRNMEENPAASGQEDVKVDVSQFDLRVGQIISAEKHPDAVSLFVVQVDVGEASPRPVVSGLLKNIPLDQMMNRMVVLLCNLRPAKVRGVPSQAMVMCATSTEKVEILEPPSGAEPGDRVTFRDFPGEPDKELPMKKKEQVLQDLHTDSQCVATYRGAAFEITGKGVCRVQSMSNSRIK